MAGTRTAPDPTVADSETSVTTTLHLMDASGDVVTEAITTTAPPSSAETEAWAAAYQAATQASLYKITVSTAYEGASDPDNATTGSRDSVKDGINMLYRNLATLRATTPRLVAPISAVMQGNQDIPLLSATEAVALLNAQAAILSGYELQSAQYTERRERSNNPRIKI